MSLVNEMLQDLQRRKAADSKPLAGLRVVTGPASEVILARPGPWWIVLVAVAVIAIVTLLWSGAVTGIVDNSLDVETVSVDADVKPVAATSVQTETATKLAGFSSLRTNRLDYYHSPPPPRTLQTTIPAKSIPPAPVTRHVPTIKSHSDSPLAEGMFKKPVSLVVALRRDGLAALRSGEPMAAERQFQKLVTADPVNPESHLFLHAALKAQSRSGAARTVLLNGLESTSEPAALAQVLAYELLADNRVSHALAVLTKHRPAGFSDLDYEAKLAAVNQRAGNHDVAAKLYGMLVVHQPSRGVWWVGLAISQEAKGQTNDARESYETATAGGTLDATLARYAAQRLARLGTGS